MEQQSLIPEVIQPEKTRGGLPNGGNGRPKGAGTRIHRYGIFEKLCESHAIETLESIIAEAKAGNMIAAKLILDRIWPAPRYGAVRMPLPKTETPADLLRAQHEIWDSIAAGHLAPDEGNQLIETIKHMIQAYAIEPIAAVGQAAATVTTIDMRDALADRLIRQIRMRQAQIDAQNGESAQADDAA